MQAFEILEGANRIISTKFQYISRSFSGQYLRIPGQNTKTLLLNTAKSTATGE